jgi:TonB-dependent SusC/RagA subfamily outer membrane receptor
MAGVPLTAAAGRVATWVTAAIPVPVARQIVPWLLGAWGAASLTVLLVLLAGYHRLLRRIRTGVPQVVDGVPVVVTDAIGPLVAGVRAPRIVVPRWLLTRPVTERALVLAHEQAHLAARDPFLLVASAVGTVLLPWNPVSWALLARLRLAIEVDCDQRVLRLGAPTGHYGRLLIDLAAAAPRLPLSAPAFSYHTTHLERRLRTMTTPAPRHRGARASALAAIATLALVTACESQLPTAAEVERMDVAALEARTAAGLPGAPSGPTYFFVDGRQLTEAEAKALPAGKITAIEVVKAAKGAGTVREVRITTGGDSVRVVRGMLLEERRLDSGAVTAVRIAGVRTDSAVFVASDSMLLRLDRNDASSSGTPVKTLKVELGRRAGADTNAAFVIRQNGTAAGLTAQPLLIVDGVRQPQEALKRLAPDAIQSIEVIKGAAATKLYGPDGANGVIVVTSKGKR